jgi:hypothetical protein
MDFGTFFLSFWTGGAYTWEYFVFHQGCFYTYCLIVFISDPFFSLLASAITYTSSAWKGYWRTVSCCFSSFWSLGMGYYYQRIRPTHYTLYIITIRFNLKPFLFPSTLNFSFAFSVSSALLVRKGVIAQGPGNNSVDQVLQKGEKILRG